MKTLKLILTATLLMMLSSHTGWTADGESEATIRLMGAAEAELPEAVTKQITIPAHLMNAGVDVQKRVIEKADKGLKNANARSERPEKGQLHAEDARDRGAEMSERAKEKRDTRGRSEDRPERPDGPPGPP